MLKIKSFDKKSVKNYKIIIIEEHILVWYNQLGGNQYGKEGGNDMDIYNVANAMKLERKTIFDLKLRVTFYGRVSTLKMEQDTSIDSQISYFTQFIENNPNWEYIPGYADRIRGESAASRDEFMRMIKDAKMGKFDLIITKEVSRFARDIVDSLSYARELLRYGVGLFFQNDNICTIDTDSELRLAIMSSIAQDEVRKMSERIKWGHKRSIENGHVMGNSRIYGWDKDKCKLVVNEKDAEMIRLIFDLYETGEYSSNRIEGVLWEKGYRSRTGGRIAHNTIMAIIRNPKCKGYYCGNKVKIVDYRTKEQKFLPEKDWIMYKDETGEIIPAIVSEEQWDRCHEIDMQRRKITQAYDRAVRLDSAFTGKLWCSVHDRPYWRTSYKHYKTKETIYKWVCSEKKRHGSDACESFMITESEIYSMLSQVFKDTSENIKDYIETFIRIYKETDGNEGLKKQINSLKAQFEKETKKRDKLLELYMDEAISKAEFQKRNNSIGILLANLEIEISTLEKSDSETYDQFKLVKDIEKYFVNMYSPDTEMTKEQLDEMILAIVDAIFITPINPKKVRLDIKLKSGENKELFYDKSRNKVHWHSGHMSLTI